MEVGSDTTVESETSESKLRRRPVRRVVEDPSVIMTPGLIGPEDDNRGSGTKNCRSKRHPDTPQGRVDERWKDANRPGKPTTTVEEKRTNNEYSKYGNELSNKGNIFPETYLVSFYGHKVRDTNYACPTR